MSQQLQPTAVAVGLFVAVIDTAYDMRDRGGDAGTSYKLWMLRVDPETGKHLGVDGFKVPTPIVPQVIKLTLGTPIQAEVAAFARKRGDGAVQDWQLRRLVDGKTGEVVAEHKRAA